MADKLYVSTDDVTQMSTELGKRIKDHCKVNGIKVDCIGYIPRGGLAVANLVGRLMGAEAERYYALCMKSYDNETRQQSKDGIKMFQMPDPTDVKGKIWVLLDEVCDTGTTFEAAHRWLVDNGAKQVITGVLHAKPIRSFEPTIFIAETDRWIVYPWDAAEEEGIKTPVMS